MPTPPPINLGPYVLNAPSPSEKGHIRDSLDLGTASLLDGRFLNVNQLVFTDPDNTSRTITLDKTQLNSPIADRLRTPRVIAISGDVTTSEPLQSFNGTADLYIPVTINSSAITESKLATDAVTTVKIKDGAVTPAKLSGVFPDWGDAGTLKIKQPGVEIGTGITADTNSFIDFHSSFPVAAVDYDARIWRHPGVNGALNIINVGAGNINIGGGLSVGSGNLVTSSRQLIGSIEITGNQINTTAASNVEIALNFENSDSTTNAFLNTTVFNGKRDVSARFFGDTKTLETYGPCRSITNGQIGWATAGLESRSSTGNALLSLHASGATAVLLRHVRGGSGVEVRAADDSSNAPLVASNLYASGGNVIINNAGPTLYLQDTDNRSAMVHVNSNQFYVLRGKENNSLEYVATNGAWPLVINLENNYASFGGGMYVKGALSAAGDVIAYSTSDKNLKDNVKNIEEPLSKIQKINGVTFDWNTDKQETYLGSDVGVLAQEIEEILPEAVTTREDGYMAVKYEKIIPLLIESVKQLSTMVETLQTKIINLENR
jgi:hypothetical protein